MISPSTDATDRLAPATLWRRIQRDNFTNLNELADYLELNAQQKSQLLAATPFVLNLPRRLAQKISKARLDDPLLVQFLPVVAERDVRSGYNAAPVEDERFRRAPKLLHKYEGRALLITTGACAMHCRYCFRQNFPYERGGVGERELELLANDSSIEEVILSGGDPLSLGDVQLSKLLGQLTAISHVKRIRFHTRFPIGIPERLDTRFLHLLENCPAQIWFVVHVNHPKELDDDVCAALKSVQRLGIPVLNQAVLLKGVNDDLEVLRALSLRLIDGGITPYYLHQLDRVAGAQRFEVSDFRAMQLIEALREVVPGYAVPTLVREIPGKGAKSPLPYI